MKKIKNQATKSMYNLLVENKNDLIGIIAYGMYKEQKNAFVENVNKTHNRDVTDQELFFFNEESRKENKLGMYRSLAEEIIAEFLDTFISKSDEQYFNNKLAKKHSIKKYMFIVSEACLCVFLSMGAFYFTKSESILVTDPILFSMLSFGLFLFSVLFFYFLNDLLDNKSNNNVLTDYKVKELKETLEEDFFPKLIRINFDYLDKYYKQTQVQAEKSFKLSLMASSIGLFIIIIGIIMMFNNKTTPAYITTATGVLSEFISAVFFYLYNKTILKMSEYHKKLVLTQNVSIALKLSNDMDEENKIKVQSTIIDRLTTDINKHLTDKD